MKKISLSSPKGKLIFLAT